MIFDVFKLHYLFLVSIGTYLNLVFILSNCVYMFFFCYFGFWKYIHGLVFLTNGCIIGVNRTKKNTTVFGRLNMFVKNWYYVIILMSIKDKIYLSPLVVQFQIGFLPTLQMRDLQSVNIVVKF